MEDSRTARHDRCVFCGWFSVLFFSLSGSGPVRKVYCTIPARIAICNLPGIKNETVSQIIDSAGGRAESGDYNSIGGPTILLLRQQTRSNFILLL